MTSVLLVEDDATLGASLSSRLEEEGYRVSWAKTISEAAEHLRAAEFQLSILDIGLPDGSGLSLARTIRETSNTPIIFLSAMNSAEFRLEGFEIGADDYIPKPFHLKELLLRIARVLAGRQKPKRLESAGVTLDLDERSLTLMHSNEKIFPQQRDFEILQFLVEATPRPVSREEIIQKLFPSGELPTPRTIDNSITRLRAQLSTLPSDPIRSVRGIGYQWVA